MTPQEESVPSHVCICGDPNCKIPYGYCHCGCGQKTSIEKVNRWRLVGHIKGSPVPRIPGHIGTRRDSCLSEHPIVDGDSCRVIVLTRGKVAIVVDSDYEKQGKFLWFSHKSGSIGDFYAARKKRVKGKLVRVFLHREILGLPPGEPTQGDHINGNTLDCRPRNLRAATQSQNSKNRKKYKNNTTGYKGVTLYKKTGKYVAAIFLHGKNKQIGTFLTPQAAHEAYCEAARINYGEFARFE